MMHNTKSCSQSKPIFVIQTYEERHNASAVVQSTSENLHQENNHNRCIRQSSLPASFPPPPPPPLPLDGLRTGSTNARVNTFKMTKPQKPRAPPVPEKRSTLSYHQAPPCPPPDYDSVSLSSSVPAEQNGFPKPSQYSNVEMESLESFELHSPFENHPKPPEIYFSNTSTPTNGSISSSTSTLRKQRPVSITIGEYGNGNARKQPGKLDLLPNGKDEPDRRTNQSITSRFASELAQTLNRSNLRRRTESMENLLNSSHIKPQSNGSVRISLSRMSENVAKSTNDLSVNSDAFSNVFPNRVAMSINSSGEKEHEKENGISNFRKNII